MIIGEPKAPHSRAALKSLRFRIKPTARASQLPNGGTAEGGVKGASNERWTKGLMGVWAAAAIAALATAAPASAQESAAEEPSPAQNGAETADRGRSWLSVEERSWLVSVEHLTPTLYNRRMDVTVVEAARAWRFDAGVELQGRFGLIHTSGERTDIDLARLSDPDLTGDSTTTGMTASLGGRYDVELDRFALFVDASAGFMWTQGQQFPAGGTAINGLLRAGGGVSFDLNEALALELQYVAAHVSNGGRPPQNPTWEGEGLRVALRLQR